MAINKDYLDYITQLNIGVLRFKRVILNSSLVTTNLMTRLKHHVGDRIDEFCEDPIDVLYLCVNNKYWTYAMLVVLYIPHNVMGNMFPPLFFGNRTYVLSDLKKKPMTFAMSTINDACQKVPLTNGKILDLWEKPYQLKAVTNYDKDFKKIWNNDTLVYEGNQYGDTSNFYIVGTLEI